MTGPNVRLRECVVKLDDDREECIFCGHKFGKGTSLSRIRHHLLGVKGKGVKPCIGNVPEEIKEAALGRDDSSHKLPGGDLASGLADQSWDTIHAETTFLLDETRRDPLPTSSTVLEKVFEANARQIRSWIMDDEVSTIGIYGKAGVGKTELLKHIHNELLQSQDGTHRLYWVPVPQNFSIERLQNLIAKRIGLDLSSEDDDQSRATKLSKELWRNQGWILFLDDLWDDCLDDFELDAVGIPTTIKGCKLIVSTRSQDVCQTVADRCIKVNPLSHKEAVFLFKKKLGPDIEFCPEKCRIANCIVRKCGGLPLGIIVMARSMKRLRYDQQWRHALQDLEQSSASHFDMEKMEGVPPSFMDVDVNQLDLQAQEDNFNMSELPSSPAEEVPVNQSSMLCNDQAGQKTLVDNNDSIQQTTQFPPSFPQTMMEGAPLSSMDDIVSLTSNQLDFDTLMSELPPSFPQTMTTMGHLDGTSSSWKIKCSTMLPEPSQTLRSPQFPPHNLQVSGDHNQGQVDQASVIPHIDNMQLETLLPRNFGKSTRSQMDNLQVRGLQNRAARPNASNPGPDSSLQSQNSGLNTQQVKKAEPWDPFWNYVEEKNDDSMICMFCRHRWASKIPITRIKWHLSGERRHGVAICHGVTKEVQEEALKATRAGNKRHKSIASSINVNDRRISTCPQEQNIKNKNIRGGIGRVIRGGIGRVIRTEQVHNVQDTIRVRTEPVEEEVLEKSGRSAVQAGAGSNKTRGVPFPTSFNNYIQHVDRNDSLEETRLMESTSGRLVQPGTSASSTKLVGREFEKNMIWSWLMDDKVSIIGIYGMGGNGKTVMLKNICNELLERHDISHSIYWVNVPQDFKINRSQDLIAKRLDLNLSSKDDDLCRVVELAKELMMKQKWILILNDLWNSFDPQELGIPLPMNGSKFIMTTRSEMVCQQMNCQNSIRVDRLSDEESLTLFMEKLGHDRQLSQEEKRIAEVAVRECDGLPLGIVTLAECLKGVDELHKWKITLKRLQESNFWDMEDQIFKTLRLSYDCLDNSAKQCFVYCALFDESQKIERRELIESFIVEGIIKEFDMGHSILDSLENVCLLERIDDGKAVKMHDLLRDMAIQILADEYSLDMNSTNQANEPQGVSSPLKNLFSPGLGSYYCQLCSPSVKHDVIMDDVQSVVKEKTEPIASMLEQSNAILHKLSGDDGRIQVGVQGLEEGAEEELICLHPEVESGMENTFAEYIQHVDINDSLEQTRLMESPSRRLVQPGTSASSTKLVGRVSVKNAIWSCLMDDKVSIIGIYGMGGNGKTTMLRNICTELLERQDISHSIYWVNVPQDFRIDKSQDLIAKRLDLNLSSKDDDQCRVVELAKELIMKQKWILILNDLWNSFDPQELGVPIPLNGSKFIMTTRSKTVCQQMNCQNSIRVDRLSDEEALTLFMEKLGHDRQLSQEEQQITKDVVRECDGLPLGIVTLAESLKGVDDLHKWKITLKRLKESNFWEMEDQIFKTLRLSYDCLDDSAKQCFVYCALFDESHKIERGELIESFIDEGIIKEKSTPAAFDKGHSILDGLENICLLERIDDGSAVKMHDLLRDMAIQILDDEYSLDMAKEERG